MIEFRIPMKKILFGFAWLAATAALTARPDINTVGARGLSNKTVEELCQPARAPDRPKH